MVLSSKENFFDPRATDERCDGGVLDKLQIINHVGDIFHFCVLSKTMFSLKGMNSKIGLVYSAKGMTVN